MILPFTVLRGRTSGRPTERAPCQHPQIDALLAQGRAKCVVDEVLSEAFGWRPCENDNTEGQWAETPDPPRTHGSVRLRAKLDELAVVSVGL